MADTRQTNERAGFFAGVLGFVGITLGLLMILLAIWSPFGSWWQWALTSLMTLAGGLYFFELGGQYDRKAGIQLSLESLATQERIARDQLNNLVIARSHLERKSSVPAEVTEQVLDSKPLSRCPCGCAMMLRGQDLGDWERADKARRAGRLLAVVVETGGGSGLCRNRDTIEA